MQALAKFTFAVIMLISMPMSLINKISGIVCAIWLAIAGQWLLLVAALVLVIAVPFIYSIVLLPTLPISAFAVNALNKDKRGVFLAAQFTAQFVGVAAIMFYVFFVINYVIKFIAVTQMNPYLMLLFGFAVVSTPFSYMASKTQSDADLYTAGAADVAYFIFSITYLTGNESYAFLIVGVFCMIFILSGMVMVELQHRQQYADVSELYAD